MPLNRTCLGKQYPTASTAVTLAAIQQYARACNDENPRYFDVNSPGGILAPPMFAVVVTWLPVLTAMTDPDLHADLLRLLHSTQDVEFLAPIHPGDIITTIAKIVSIDAAPGGETLALQLDATNQQGDTVTRIIFTVLIRQQREAGISRESRSSATDEPPRGKPLLSIAQTIDHDQTFRYAEASGDRNPIHIDENVAKMAGLPGIIVHGLCTMAFTAKIIVDQLCAGDPARLMRLAVRFSRPVFPGDTITTKVWPGNERKGHLVYAYETYNPEGLAVIRNGTAEISS
jgi:acyl dehydratase